MKPIAPSTSSVKRCRLVESDLWRRLVQAGFLLTVLTIGFQFIRFIDALATGGALSVHRPPGVEAFLPISALMGLKQWLVTGVFDRVHPAGLIILITVMACALLLKRAFCGWVCPFGLLSDALDALHRRLWRRRHHLPRSVDLPLRAVKYLVLGFFLWVVMVRMDARSLAEFLNGRYNAIAGFRMLAFFRHPSETTTVVLGLSVIATLAVPYFWCRYLCPYGALLGALSLASPFRIRRFTEACTGCGRCRRACPAGVAVDRREVVRSAECHACLRCIAACPEPEALGFCPVGGRKRLSPMAVGVLVVSLFLGGSLAARAGGVWQSRLPPEAYRLYAVHWQMDRWPEDASGRPLIRKPMDQGSRRLRQKALPPVRETMPFASSSADCFSDR